MKKIFALLSVMLLAACAQPQTKTASVDDLNNMAPAAGGNMAHAAKSSTSFGVGAR